VGGVGDEAALGLERPLQPRQQGVEGDSQLAQLVGRARVGKALVQVVLGDLLGR
jgi:hypothetical protein